MTIIDIPLPNSCEECPIPYITDELDLKCPFQKLYVTGLGERPDGCPLREVKHVPLDIQTIKDIDRGFKALNAIDELSCEMKGVNRSIMNEDTLVGFNMAIALCNKHFKTLKEN